MVINRVAPNQSFGNLYRAYTVTSRMKSKGFVKELKRVEAIIRKNKFDKKRHVDIYLNYDEKGFSGLISSKKQGVPNNPRGICPISTDKDSIRNFGTWLKEWDYAYSPRGLREYKALQRKCLKIMKETLGK